MHKQQTREGTLLLYACLQSTPVQHGMNNQTPNIVTFWDYWRVSSRTLMLPATEGGLLAQVPYSAPPAYYASMAMQCLHRSTAAERLVETSSVY